MAVPQSKKSKSKKRMRKAANRYKGLQTSFCKVCNEPLLPHRACPACGNYKDKQVITVTD